MAGFNTEERPSRAAACGLFALFFLAACGAGRFSVGSVPFPAPEPVFQDESGRLLSGLPDSPEPYRLIFFDYPWCPPCVEAWKAVGEASREIPAGSVRVYRVLFDRERLFGKEGTSEVAPLRPSPPTGAGSLPVTNVLALPGPFRRHFGPSMSPLVILADRDGKVLRKWTGYSPSLSAAMASEVKGLSSSPPPPEM